MTDQINSKVVGNLGHITLNRPTALNALPQEMCEEITKLLLAWERDPNIGAVVVDGAGDRAFCAGGDVILLHDSGKAGDDRAGYFPDVGGTYFLPRLGLEIGQWLGLTGARLNAGLSCEFGVANAYVPSADHGALIEALGRSKLDGSDAADITEEITARSLYNFRSLEARGWPYISRGHCSGIGLVIEFLKNTGFL